jgi:hypothetical protein
MFQAKRAWQIGFHGANSGIMLQFFGSPSSVFGTSALHPPYLSRTYFGIFSGPLRDFFDSSSRVTEANPKKSRRNPEQSTAQVRLRYGKTPKYVRIGPEQL